MMHHGHLNKPIEMQKHIANEQHKKAAESRENGMKLTHAQLEQFHDIFCG